MTANLFAVSIASDILSSMQFLVFAAMVLGALICLGFSAVFGDHHDTDMGHDHDVGHAGGESGPSFLSPRAFFAFLLGFSTAGAIATAYGASAAIATAIGFIPGLVMALIAWGVASFLYKQQANSSLRPGQVIGAHGTVVTAIPAGGIGEVNVSVNGQIVGYTATADGIGSIKAGTMIVVTQDLGDRVVVKARSAVAA